MEFPVLFGKKRASQRPRPPEERDHAHHVHHRFSRAYGVLGHLKRKMGDGQTASLTLETYKQDCRQEIIDAIASDAYRTFLEHELGANYRLEHGTEPRLHVASDEGLVELELLLIRSYDRRGMDHAYAFAIGMLNGAITKFLRSQDTRWLYQPPITKDSPEQQGLRAIMSDYAFREEITRRHGIRISFLLPRSVCFLRGSPRAFAEPTLAEQLRLEGHMT